MYALTEVLLLCEKIIATGAQKWMIISVEDGEGKTTLCSQISHCLESNLLKKVHFIDTNHRNPYESQTLKNPVKYTNFSKLDLSDVVENNEVCNRNLEEDEVYIIDTSPVMIYNRNNIHPLSLKGIVDGAILIVNSNYSKKRDVQKVITMLKNQDLPLLAMVLNSFNNGDNEKPSSITHLRKYYTKYKIKLIRNTKKTKQYASEFIERKKIKKTILEKFNLIKKMIIQIFSTKNKK